MALATVGDLLAELDLTRQVATRTRVTAARQLNALFADAEVARALARPWHAPATADVCWDDVLHSVAGLAMAAFTSALGSRATPVGDKQRAITVLCNAIAAAAAAGHAMATALRPLYADCEWRPHAR